MRAHLQHVDVQPKKRRVCKKMAKKKKETKTDYVVKKAVQDFARANNMMVGSDSYDAINAGIHAMLEGAAERAKANKRKTLKAYDF